MFNGHKIYNCMFFNNENTTLQRLMSEFESVIEFQWHEACSQPLVSGLIQKCGWSKMDTCFILMPEMQFVSVNCIETEEEGG